jgi:hypothetical protein
MASGFDKDLRNSIDSEVSIRRGGFKDEHPEGKE